MTTQAELDFTAVAPDPRVAAAIERLPDLVAALKGQGWKTRRELEALGFGDRELRLIVQHDKAREILSFPGSPGYCLFDEATLEDIRKADAMKSQGEDMIDRWKGYQIRLHRRGRTSKP